jgi:nitrogen regulatory protein P-II 1
MKEVLAVVRPFRAIEVLREIAKFDVESLRVAEARGYGRQKDQLERYKGREFGAVYLPKIEVRFVVRDDLVDVVVGRIIAAARTGRIGDGKILVLPVAGSVEF